MTVDQVIDTLKLEKQQRVPSRFPWLSWSEILLNIAIFWKS